jgi:tetratricopeptide (TPR) repeat protein
MSTEQPSTSAENHYTNGNAAYHRGKHQEAITQYAETIKLNSNHHMAFFQRAQAYYSLGEYDKAAADYQSAIDFVEKFGAQHPDKKYLPYAYANLATAKFLYAEKTNTRTAQTDNDIFKIYEAAIKTELLLSMGLLADSTVLATSMRTLDIRESSLFSKSEAMQNFLKEKFSAKSETSLKKIENAQGEEKNNLIKEILHDANWLISYFPGEKEGFYYRGKIGLLKGTQNDYLQAEEDFKQAERLDLNDHLISFSLGETQRLLGKFPEAIESLTNAIQQNSNFSEAYCTRGRAKQEQGKDLTGALEDYGESIKLDQDYPDAYYHRGTLKATQKYPTNLRNAKEDFEKIFNLHESKSNHLIYLTHLELGKIEEQMGNKDSAIQEFNESIKLKPTLEAHYHRGTLKANMGNLKGAEQDKNQLQKLVESNKNNYLAHYYLGTLKQKLGDIDGAISSFTFSLSYNPKFAEAGQALDEAKELQKKNQNTSSNAPTAAPENDIDTDIFSSTTNTNSRDTTNINYVLSQMTFEDPAKVENKKFHAEKKETTVQRTYQPKKPTQ